MTLFPSFRINGLQCRGGGELRARNNSVLRISRGLCKSRLEDCLKLFSLIMEW